MITNREKMSLENWKTKVTQSSHLRTGETAIFSNPTGRLPHIIYATIKTIPYVTLGCYFLADMDENNTNTGWYWE